MNDDIENDEEIIEAFLEESREHLTGIEDDLLSIEAAGADVDEELVNKVFRGAHSIKGAAGFFGFETIKELAHAMENILGMIRSREIIAESAVVGLLLEGADELTDLINDLKSSNNVDLSGLLARLRSVQDGGTSDEEHEVVEVEDDVQIVLSNGSVPFSVSRSDIERAQSTENGGDAFYVIEYDLVLDIQLKDKTPLSTLDEVAEIAVIVDTKVDLEKVGTLDAFDQSSGIPFFILISTTLQREMVATLLELDEDRIERVLLSPSGEDEEDESAEGAMGAEGSTRPSQEAGASSSAATLESAPQPTPAAVESAPAPRPSPPSKSLEAKPRGSKRGQRQHEGAQSTDSTIRVKLPVLDRLMTLAGELVLTRNQLVQSVGVDDSMAVDATQRIDLVTTELQDAIMSTRMRSIGLVFQKFRRIVRDLSSSLDKKVDLILEGEEVELDRAIIEAIGDPLTHLVRNALDHGIERPEQRSAAEKTPNAMLRLSAYHKAGNVIIEIEDDGKGIDPEKVKAKALAQGIITREQFESITDQAAIRLIFKPGFSMAAKVTDISGRGVGMDVVHSNLTRLGGVVDVDSQVGRGTIVQVKLPLTLAIIPCLLVTEEGETFAIPQSSLIELHRIPARDVPKRIERLGTAHVMRLRGELLPLVRLRNILGMGTHTYCEGGVRANDQRRALADRRALDIDGASPGDVEEERRYEEERRKASGSAVYVAIVAAGEYHYGLMLESLLDSSEIVVKPLGQHLRGCPAYAGATILGDGQAALILDSIGLGHFVGQHQADDARSETRRAWEIQKRADSMTVLLLESGEHKTFAVPLGLVQRIERIQREQIEDVAGRRTMKYRHGSLLLLSVDDAAHVPPIGDYERLYVIVFKTNNREVGLLATELVDVVDCFDQIDEISHHQPGIHGSLIHDDQIILLIDLHGLASAVYPELAEAAASHAVGSEEKEEEAQRHCVLVVDDSSFFRRKITEFVEASGHDVVVAEDGQEALEILGERHEDIDMVLTDIEMPRVDGFEMTRRLRRNSDMNHLPVVAITSVMGHEAEALGQEVGLDDYLVKLDRDLVVERVGYYLTHGRDAAQKSIGRSEGA